MFSEGRYALRVSAERPPVTAFTVEVAVDGVTVGELSYPVDYNGGTTARTEGANLSRGAHKISIVNGSEPIELYSLTVTEQKEPATAGHRALHHRLLGIEAGQTPVAPRVAVKRLLAKVLPQAYRQPVEPPEIERVLRLYDRAAERGDPFEEALKYALKGVLISPRYLFRVEQPPDGQGLHPLSSYEMASRLSYFLWSTSPDEELLKLAADSRLQDSETLARQVDRMLDDSRSRALAGSFVGQWLGTNEIGGRAVPLLTELQHFYTPAVAADLREQPELFFHYILTENRSVLDLLDAPYTFLTARLAKYYQIEDGVQGLGPSGFERVNWPDDRRAGVLGLASVLAMTSHYHQASPVLRGAWVLETLLGTPVPPPPPDVPELPPAKKGQPLPIRELLEAHRASTACAACHNLMDPIGLALENFDWMGRWRDTEPDGRPVDASGALPSGETFNGPVELRAVLIERKEEFLRQLVGKVLGYAIGRGQQDGDQCTIEQIAKRLVDDGYRARTLIREIVLSAPFRNLQGGIEITHQSEPLKRAPRRLLGTK